MFGTFVVTTLVLSRLVIPVAVIVMIGTAIQRRSAADHTSA